MHPYQSPEDLLLVPQLAALAPAQGKAFLAFVDHAEKQADGHIPPKIREWIALVSAAVRAGATVGHGLLALRLLKETPEA